MKSIITPNFVVLVTLIVTLESITCVKIPSYIELCHRNDPKINDCLKKAITDLRPHMLKGVPDLFIPPLNPLIVPEATLDQGKTFKATFKNIEVYHFEEFILKDLDLDIKDEITLRLQLSLPRLRIKSQYTINGKLLIVQLNGQGPADGNFTNVEVKLLTTGTRYLKNGKEHITYKNRKLEMDLGKPVFRFDNLFKDNVELNEQTNKIINENIKNIIEELNPVIEETVAQLVIGIVLKVLETYSFDDLFPL